MACILGYSNFIDASTLSNGTWNASYPQSNLKTRYLNQKARSTTTTATIDMDLGAAQSIGVVALIKHNLTTTATVRIQGAAANTFATNLYDSGTVTVYAHTDYALQFTSVSARYWRITITDTSNALGYVELARVFIGKRFAPTNNIDWAASIGVESKTVIQESLAGVEYFDTRPNRRIWQGKWSWLSDAEAYSTLIALQRSQDVSGEVYLFEESTDTLYRDQRWFLGRFRTLNAIEWPYVSQHSCGVEIGELL